MSNLHGPDFPDLPELFISQDGVEKLLSVIQASKASGPDLILCRFLKELAHEISPILTIIFNTNYRMESSNPTGEMLMLLLSSRRVPIIWWRTTTHFL